MNQPKEISTKNNGYAACVDVGGTKIAVTLSFQNQLIVNTRVVTPTPVSGQSTALATQIVSLIDQACAIENISSTQLNTIGVSSCGPFLKENGKISLAAPNICGGIAGKGRGLPNDWLSAPLQAPLEHHFKTCKIRIENDAIAALEAERRWGALQNLDHCAYVTWSTGIGVGLCVDGHILNGKNGNAGHAGHLLDRNALEPALCGCGNNDDVEGLIAGNALARRFSQFGFQNAALLIEAAKTGNAQAMNFMDSVCATMARMLHALAITLDLQAVSIGGSVFWHHKDWLMQQLKTHISPYPSALMAGFELKEAGLGQNVGDYAALALTLG